MIITSTGVFSAPQVTTFSAAGAYTYTVPQWATHIDVILLGGGEAGTGVVFANGSGGKAGSWRTVTLARGATIPWGTTTITGIVGAGGTGNGGDGASTTANVSGGGTYTAAGGSGNMGAINPAGEAAGTQSYNNQSYVGGGSQGALGGAGVAPGGGGAGGGFGTSVGGGGAVGQVWFYAYNVAAVSSSGGLAFDAVGSGANTTGSMAATTIAGTHTTTGDAVLVAVNAGGLSAVSISNVTYGGQSLTLLGSINMGGTNTLYPLHLYGMLNPPLGMQSVSATTNVATLGFSLASVSYAGVSSFGSVSTASSGGTGTTALSHTVSTTSGSMLVQVFGQAGATTISGYSQTQRFVQPLLTGLLQGDAVAGSNSVTFSATASGNVNWGSIAIELN